MHLLTVGMYLLIWFGYRQKAFDIELYSSQTTLHTLHSWNTIYNQLVRVLVIVLCHSYLPLSHHLDPPIVSESSASTPYTFISGLHPGAPDSVGLQCCATHSRVKRVSEHVLA